MSEEPIPKRRKLNFVDELAKSVNDGSNLLEKLREAPDWNGPDTDEEMQKVTDLIEENLSLLPAKIRRIFELEKEVFDLDADWPERPASYYGALGISVVDFFEGAHLESYDRSAWHGPSVDVDTEDEVELLIRLFPTVFVHVLDSVPQKWANSEKAVSFIPLLLESHPWLRGQVNMVDLAVKLLVNETVEFNPITPERDEKSLSVLVQLREKGLLENSTVRSLIFGLLAIGIDPKAPRSFEFMQKRLSLLIKWDPSILTARKETNGRASFLLTVFVSCQIVYRQRYENFVELDKRFYESLLEEGSLHYPKELLGFGFNGCNFELACTAFGKRSAREVMEKKMHDTFKQGNNDGGKYLAASIVKAATDDSIDLDGLYSLIRFDPNVLKNAKQI